MTKLFNKFAFVTASTVISFAVVNTNSVNAVSITYDFEVTIDSGSLDGQIFPGSFTFENSSLLGSGEEFLSVSDLSFTFQGVSYTEADSPEAAFLDSDFLGLNFSPDPSFSFIPGFFDLEEAFFTYDFQTGADDAGAGDISYIINSEMTGVPEPSNILVSLAAMGLGMFFKRKLK